jgi:hypothetical protein
MLERSLACTYCGRCHPGGQILSRGGELVVTTAAIARLDPHMAGLAVVAPRRRRPPSQQLGHAERD